MRRISRLLLGIVTCVVPVFIAACYGIAYTFTQRGRVVDKTSKTGVAGLRFECRSASNSVSDVTHTAADGTFDLHARDANACTTIAVEDDGRATTRYASTTAKPNAAKDLVVEVAMVP